MVEFNSWQKTIHSCSEKKTILAIELYRRQNVNNASLLITHAPVPRVNPISTFVHERLQIAHAVQRGLEPRDLEVMIKKDNNANELLHYDEILSNLG